MKKGAEEKKAKEENQARQEELGKNDSLIIELEDRNSELANQLTEGEAKRDATEEESKVQTSSKATGLIGYLQQNLEEKIDDEAFKLVLKRYIKQKKEESNKEEVNEEEVNEEEEGMLKNIIRALCAYEEAKEDSALQLIQDKKEELNKILREKPKEHELYKKWSEIYWKEWKEDVRVLRDAICVTQSSSPDSINNQINPEEIKSMLQECVDQLSTFIQSSSSGSSNNHSHHKEIKSMLEYVKQLSTFIQSSSPDSINNQTPDSINNQINPREIKSMLQECVDQLSSKFIPDIIQEVKSVHSAKLSSESESFSNKLGHFLDKLKKCSIQYGKAEEATKTKQTLELLKQQEEFYESLRKEFYKSLTEKKELQKIILEQQISFTDTSTKSECCIEDNFFLQILCAMYQKDCLKTDSASKTSALEEEKLPEAKQAHQKIYLRDFFEWIVYRNKDDAEKSIEDTKKYGSSFERAIQENVVVKETKNKDDAEKSIGDAKKHEHSEIKEEVVAEKTQTLQNAIDQTKEDKDDDKKSIEDTKKHEYSEIKEEVVAEKPKTLQDVIEQIKEDNKAKKRDRKSCESITEKIDSEFGKNMNSMLTVGSSDEYSYKKLLHYMLYCYKESNGLKSGSNTKRFNIAIDDIGDRGSTYRDTIYSFIKDFIQECNIRNKIESSMINIDGGESGDTFLIRVLSFLAIDDKKEHKDDNEKYKNDEKAQKIAEYLRARVKEKQVQQKLVKYLKEEDKDKYKQLYDNKDTPFVEYIINLYNKQHEAKLGESIKSITIDSIIHGDEIKSIADFMMETLEKKSPDYNKIQYEMVELFNVTHDAKVSYSFNTDHRENMKTFMKDVIKEVRGIKDKCSKKNIQIQLKKNDGELNDNKVIVALQMFNNLAHVIKNEKMTQEGQTEQRISVIASDSQEHPCKIGEIVVKLEIEEE